MTGKIQGYWIFSPLQDLTFVLLTPLAILLTFTAAQRGGWIDGLVAFALALAMAHYFPGILRAYGDRALFRRFRVRLIIAPLFLILTTGWFAYMNLNFVFLLAGLWGAWHWMMQVYGFARIYDAKAPAAARTPARLDQMICLLWFGTCVFVLNDVFPLYVERFYESGGSLLPASAFLWFKRAWFVATLGLTLFYVIRTIGAIREGRWPNPLKWVLIAITFVYLRYTASLVDQPQVAWAMFESWHDIQYLAIVWMFNLSRARQNPEAGPFIRFLFRPSAILVLAYVAVCLAFGSLTHAWRLFENGALVRVAASIVIGTALLHYYLDGFIWKIREAETREALGVRTKGEAAEPRAPFSPALIPAWVRHAALWLLFVVPGTLFFLMESRGSVSRPPLQIYESLVQTFPDSSHANFQLGKELQDVGRLREAKVHLEKTVAGEPDLYPALVRLAALLADQGDFAGAIPYFERAMAINDEDAEVHNNYGIVLDEHGNAEKAKVHLERAIALNPEYALAHNNLGIVLVKLGKLAEAKAHFETALRIQPDYTSAKQNLEKAEVALQDR
jgi:Tfp pilus assembly protein PilF